MMSVANTTVRLAPPYSTRFPSSWSSRMYVPCDPSLAMLDHTVASFTVTGRGLPWTARVPFISSENEHGAISFFPPSFVDHNALPTPALYRTYPYRSGTISVGVPVNRRGTMGRTALQSSCMMNLYWRLGLHSQALAPNVSFWARTAGRPYVSVCHSALLSPAYSTVMGREAGTIVSSSMVHHRFDVYRGCRRSASSASTARGPVRNSCWSRSDSRRGRS